MKTRIIIFLLLSLPVVSLSQSDTLRKDALKVYMDASDYIKKEIPYVNYVRDIKDADVYIIDTYQTTGAGGYEYSYFFVGKNEFSGMSDTLTFVSSPDDTSDIIREKQVRTLKIGLMRYIAKTPLSEYIRINFSEPLTETVSSDKWTSWVFKASLNGYFSIEKSYKYNYLYGTLSANKITEDWKINLYSRYYKYKSKYIIDENNTIEGSNDSKYIRGLIVKSINDHWSVGGTSKIGSASYSNEKGYINLLPAIEYDLFPYSESTRRQLRILYSAGYNYVNYIDSTIYDKIEESLWLHSLSASYEVIQKWGSVDVVLEYSNYLHDWSKNNLSLYTYLSLRIVKGLSVSLSANASIIHDQLGLVKQGLSTEEILLQRKEIATQYDLYLSFGFSYTFGSIYNNVVNPRFGE